MNSPVAAAASSQHLAHAPLGAGDLIDRTVRLYRRHFFALLRASAPPVVVSALGGVLWVVGVRGFSSTAAEAKLALYFLLAAFAALLFVVGQLLNLVVMGGASRALVRHLLWGESVTARAVFRAVRARFWALLGAAVAVALCSLFAAGVGLVVWYLLLLVLVVGGVLVAAAGGGAPGALTLWVGGAVAALWLLGASFLALWLFFWLAGRVAYVPQALLVEGRGVFAAVARSAELARGNTRRLMATFLFTTFATYSALMLLLIPLGWYGYLHGVNPFALDETEWPAWYAVGQQVVWQSSTALLAPVWTLGLSLLYVDERVRHEGYDIELMAARVFGDLPRLPPGKVSPLTPAIADQVVAAPVQPTPTRRGDDFPHSVLGLK